MIIHDNSRQIMTIDDNSWKFMIFHDTLCQFMTIHEHSLQFMKIHENSWWSWQFLTILDNLWQFVTIHDNSWLGGYWLIWVDFGLIWVDLGLGWIGRNGTHIFWKTKRTDRVFQGSNCPMSFIEYQANMNIPVFWQCCTRVPATSDEHVIPRLVWDQWLVTWSPVMAEGAGPGSGNVVAG